jgi:hypothetical protein
VTAARVDDATNAVAAYEAQLLALHGEGGLRLDKKGRIRGVGVEQIPQSTEIVQAAVEYAFGRDHRGEGTNLYKLWFGYAHGSIEMLYAHGQQAWTSLTAVTEASADELRDFSNLTLRMNYRLLYTLSEMMGRVVSDIEAWCDTRLPPRQPHRFRALTHERSSRPTSASAPRESLCSLTGRTGLARKWFVNRGVTRRRVRRRLLLE